ncbi:MAG TPA: hypothetical protein VIK92_09360 [Thermaerobacter sp.]
MSDRALKLLLLHIPPVLAILAALLARMYNAPEGVGRVIIGGLLGYTPFYSLTIRHLL